MNKTLVCGTGTPGGSTKYMILHHVNKDNKKDS